VNVPLREPLYPAPDEKIIFNKNIKIIEEQSTEIKLNASEHNKLIKKFFQFKRILIVAGQSDYKEKMSEILAESIHKFKLPFVADVISNFHAIEEIIRHHDHFIGSDKNYKILNPDLLITFGKSVLSKNLKIFLRKNKPLEHWHFQQAGEIADTFQSLTHVIRESAEMFFKDLNEMDNDAENKQVEYFNDWHNQNAKSKDYLEQFLSQSEFGEFKAAGIILENLPSCNLHISNSMPVRYANMIGLYTRHTHIEVNVNRGTSGIDGSNSTATGASMASGKITVLITGDMAFFYDRNAFWHNYPLPNLKIIILNNHSGGIFRMIDGPSNLPELEEFFETYQPLSAKLLAEEFDFEYQMCDNEKTLIESLKTCVQKNNKTQILEILTDTKKNHSIYKSFIENFS
ncbi:MAG: thiamine pyrophosphate-dependent enzyme, partial [Bacteroidota bacterium]|nr:thiamine pyrophosphate-dependent enzyme [Bacteroidota bacterium]